MDVLPHRSFLMLWSPTGCPTIQFNSDTTWATTWAQHRPHRLRAQTHNFTDYTNFRCQSQVPGLPYFWLTGYNLGVCMTQFLRVHNCQNGSQNSGKLLLTLPIYDKRYDLETAWWKRYTGQGYGEGPGASVPSRGTVSLHKHASTHQEALCHPPDPLPSLEVRG